VSADARIQQSDFDLAPLFHTVVQDFAFKVGENGQHALRSRDGLMTQVSKPLKGSG